MEVSEVEIGYVNCCLLIVFLFCSSVRDVLSRDPIMNGRETD